MFFFELEFPAAEKFLKIENFNTNKLFRLMLKCEGKGHVCHSMKVVYGKEIVEHFFIMYYLFLC